MKHLLSLHSIALVAVVILSAQAPILAKDRPNVVVFLTDDQGWGDLSWNGNKDLSTPHIDSLAKEGAFFERFYVQPVCSPTRAEFLTGRHASRSGIYSTSSGGERIDLDEKTIGQFFQEAGYRTGAFGKWHNGMQHPYHPTARGFDEFYGFCSGHWGHYYDTWLDHNGKLVKGEGFCIDDFTNHAIDFIKDSGEKPFFVFLPYNTPHGPMQVPDAYWDRFKDKEITQTGTGKRATATSHTQCALAMCENIDDNVGRLLETLDTTGHADNTIVMYFCDNGPNGNRYNGGMLGRKGSVHEGGMRSPLHIRWPAGIEAGTAVSTQASVMDILPTLGEWCGFDTSGGAELDGRSVTSVFTEQPDSELQQRKIFGFWKGKASVRDDQMLYALEKGGPSLFDLRADPNQKTNLVTQKPEIASRYHRILEAHMQAMQAELPAVDERPFYFGHPMATYTQLPARDATVTGVIERSNHFPNASHFLNWVNTDDQIVWNGLLEKGGKFAVDLFYVCDENSVGTELSLSFNGKTLVGSIPVANDSPIISAPEDRDPRRNSVEYDFIPMRLGEVEWEAGQGDLVLQATKMTGDEVMLFRQILLTRLSD